MRILNDFRDVGGNFLQKIDEEVENTGKKENYKRLLIPVSLISTKENIKKKTKIIINPVVLIINQDKLIMFLRLSESQEHNFSGIMCSSEFLPCAPTDSCKHWPQEYQKERAGLLRQSLCPL